MILRWCRAETNVGGAKGGPDIQTMLPQLPIESVCRLDDTERAWCNEILQVSRTLIEPYMPNSSRRSNVNSERMGKSQDIAIIVVLKRGSQRVTQNVRRLFVE